MRGKWLWLIILLFLQALVILSAKAVAAFSAPWTWSKDQLYFSFLLLCAAIGLGSWIAVWMRGGTPAVKARWATERVRFGEAMTGENFRRWFFFWFALLIGLAILSTFIQH